MAFFYWSSGGFSDRIDFFEFLSESDEAWRHITQQLLPGYITNTLLLMLGVALLVLVIGVSTA